MRFHLFPFRTEKLSSLTPMVLRFSRGRVGSRLFKSDLRYQVWLFLFSQTWYLKSRLKELLSLRGKQYYIDVSDLNSLEQRTIEQTERRVKRVWTMPRCRQLKPRIYPRQVKLTNPVRGTFVYFGKVSSLSLAFSFRYAQNLSHSMQKIKRSKIISMTTK